jgi:RHH-type proline utilization regulon transcriptional repressor/proline dehydrogenase/delta 1-pyrroline-5-carboxylate dehydrogenase
MRQERLKTQLFRLVDVLPALSSNREIARHIEEYLGDQSAGLPVGIRRVLGWTSRVPSLAGPLAGLAVRRMARAFILAEGPEGALGELRAMRDRSTAFTVDLLGEAAVSEHEAETYAIRYLELIEVLADAAATWLRSEHLDSDDRGPIPAVNVSVKISALFSQIKAQAPEDSIERLCGRLRPLLRRAKARNVFINFDMEMHWLKDLTLRLFKALLDEEEFTDYRHAGIAMQAYLRETPDDLEQLIEWATKRHTRVTVRLVKGAYWDTETILACQRRWPVPVYEHKQETDAAYERLARRLLENAEVIDCAFGTHNVRTIATCLAEARRLGLPPRRLEFQMLYGMAEPIKGALSGMGYRVREYCPLGETLPGMAYLVRRLLENTSNEGFLRAKFSEDAAPQTLLRDPATVTPVARDEPNIGFKNEPHADFSRAELRDQMTNALRKVRAGLGGLHPLLVGESEVRSGRQIISRNPARPDEIVGRVEAGGREEVDLAVTAAATAFASWHDVPVETRARILERTADLLSQRRFELAALEVYETGKTWPEADADVCEAIDFCRYYAGEMCRLASGKLRVPGEEIWHDYIARGVAVVIAPWNFPLAILCGMTTAALVAGNAVIMKPSGQSAVIAAVFGRILREAGVPPGAINSLPGSGSEIGSALIEHPEVAIIAFTGSREVGLRIWEAAGRTRPGQTQLKKVVCEMGGKNAVIVDDDADLDEAVTGIVASAFGYQGQKCSALSRLIVLPRVRERLIRRVIEATESLRMGDPADPAVSVGPLIDQAAHDRVREVIEAGRQEATLAFEAPVTERTGWFVGPTIFTGVAPDSRLAQEEIFGPVLSVIDAVDLDEALRIANGTPYALTGGCYSRSPRRIEHVKSAFRVGNLYINRGITGALVARHPFGGFGMSGGGTKAGGPDYLLNFLFPKVVAENVIRRGSAPQQSGNMFSGIA